MVVKKQGRKEVEKGKGRMRCDLVLPQTEGAGFRKGDVRKFVCGLNSDAEEENNQVKVQASKGTRRVGMGKNEIKGWLEILIGTHVDPSMTRQVHASAFFDQVNSCKVRPEPWWKN